MKERAQSAFPSKNSHLFLRPSASHVNNSNDHHELQSTWSITRESSKDNPSLTRTPLCDAFKFFRV